jgi:hypothetical protein
MSLFVGTLDSESPIYIHPGLFGTHKSTSLLSRWSLTLTAVSAGSAR